VQIEGSGDRAWIGHPLGFVQIATIMLIGIAGALVTTVAPLNYAAMVSEGRITTAQIGQVATTEFIMLALSTAVFGAKLKPERVPLIVATAAAIFTLVNIGSAWTPFPLIVLLRMVSGLCQGIFNWLMLQMLARAGLPARLQGIYLGLLGTLGFGTAALYASFIIPTFGSIGGFIGLGILSGITVPLSLFLLPKKFERLAKGKTSAVLPTVLGLYGLCSIFLIFAGVIGVWVYLPSLALQQGQAKETIAIAIPFAVAMNVIGGLSSAALAARLPVRRTLIAIWAICIAMTLIWLSNPPSWIFILCTGIFGFCWFFFVPFQMSLIVELDPSRRSVIFISAADAFGAGAGPAIVSLAVSGTNVSGAIALGGAFFAAGLLMVMTEGFRDKRSSVDFAPRYEP
jgi:MFS transporter, DHA1 family, inner membrane transport protein